MKIRDNSIQTILRVDLTERTAVKEDLPGEWTEKYIGTRGITSRLLFNEVTKGTDPYGPENILYIGTGPMDGLPVGM